MLDRDSRTGAIRSFVHRDQNCRMLAPTEDVVRAPDHHIAGPAAPVVALGRGERATTAFKIDNLRVIPPIAQSIKLRAKKICVVH
jgi:hypothetical protein